jgi:RHS repeat-associated protein
MKTRELNESAKTAAGDVRYGVVSVLRRVALATMAVAGLTLSIAHAASPVALAASPSATPMTALSAKPVTQSGQSATQLADGSWLLLGGSVGNAVSGRAVVISATSGTSSTLSATLAIPRSGHSATLLPDGRVLVLGGVDSRGAVLQAAELFDPSTGSFSTLGDLGLLPRSGHTATVLTDGRLLIAGGLDGKGFAVQDVELYDPVAGKVERLSTSLDVARLQHVAALLPDSTVLLWGGVNPQGQALQSGDRYDPTAQRFSSVSADAALGLAKTLGGATAPAVLDSNPASSAHQVPVDQRLMVRFSKRMSVASLNAVTVTLIGPNGPVKIRPVAVEGGVLLFVTPEQELMPDSAFTLFIQGATDQYGQALPMAAIGFKTAALGRGGKSAANGTVSAVLTAPAGATAAAHTAPAPSTSASAPVASADDDDTWTPTEANYHGNWRSGRSLLAERTLPVHPMVKWALHGDPQLAKLKPRDVALRKLPQAPRGPAGLTAVAGQVLKLNGRPLPHVALSIGGRHAFTDANGEFLLRDVPAGHQVLVIDGETADTPQRHYGRYEYGMDVAAGQTNVLPFVSWMTPLDTQDAVKIPSPTTTTVVLTNPKIPGLELRIPPGTVIRDANGKIVTEISMTAIAVDQPPFPLPGFGVPVYFTVQPGGAQLVGIDPKSAKGAQLIYPNFSGASPGSRIAFWDYDPVSRGWFTYGQGTVSADGKQVVPDPNVVIYTFSGAMVSLPSNAPPMGPPPCGASAGDPVDLFTGLFTYDETDMVVKDVMPITVARSYRPADNTPRAFGIGTSLSYDFFMVGDTFPYTFQYMVLPNGGHVYFARISAGTSFADAVYQSYGCPNSIYYGAILKWDTSMPGSAWSVTLRDGTMYFFPDSMGSTNPRAGAAIFIRDRVGNVMTLTRDSNRNLTQISSPNGRHVALSYDGTNRVTKATDDLGRSVQYAYDSQGRLVTVTDQTGQYTRQYTYQAQSVDPSMSIGAVSATTNLITVTDKRGNTEVTNQYDANGRVIKQTYADGTTMSFVYGITQGPAPTNVFTCPLVSGGTSGGGAGYGPGSMPQCNLQNPIANVNQVDVTDERGTTARYVFDTMGNVVKLIKAVGLPEQQIYTYNRDRNTGILNNVVDPLNRTTAYQYDSLGNTTQVTQMYGTGEATTTVATYDPTYSQPTSIKDPNGNTTTFAYDAYGNLLQTTDALGHSTTMSYDAQGKLVSTQDALGHVTRASYAGGDLSSLTDGLNRKTTIFTDAVGRVRSVADALNEPVYLSYDALDHVLSTTDAKGGVASLTYDPNGNVLTQVDQNLNTITFKYDVRNRLSTRIDALGQSSTQGYEPGGIANQNIDRKGQLSAVTSFDALGRAVQMGYGATAASPTAFRSTVTNTWDAGNRLTKVVDSVSGTITRTYDDWDQLLTETTPQGSVSYTYDAGGRRSTMTVQGQPPVSYTWDAANRLTQIQQAAGAINGNVAQTVKFAYDNANRRTSTTLANGIVASYTYDSANELTGITYTKSDSTVIGTLTYSYDAAGRRTSVGGTLANMQPGVPVASTTFDANNRLKTWGAQTLAYDANGNLVNDGTNTYTWDERNRLEAINGAVTASFQYDSAGRRIGKTVGGVSTSYLYDGANATQTQSGSTTTSLLNGLGIDELYATLSGTQQSHVLADALGSTMALTNAAQAITGTYGYDAYGNTTTSGVITSWQYTGRENDGTGLYYYRARYYSPKLGRFIGEDPLGWASGQTNGYRYAGSNPISIADPSGHLNVVGQVGGSFVPGFGGEGYVGGYVTFPFFDGAKFDMGFFASGGIGAGLNVGFSSGLGVVEGDKGDVNDIRGITTNVNVGGGPGSATVMIGDNGKPIGATFGPSADLGASITHADTGAFSFREFGHWFYDWIHGGCHR